MTTMTAQTTQVYQLFIKATPEAIWDAITKPEFTIRYFHGARVENTPERHLGLGPNGEVYGDSPTLEYDPPHRLVHLNILQRKRVRRCDERSLWASFSRSRSRSTWWGS